MNVSRGGLRSFVSSSVTNAERKLNETKSSSTIYSTKTLLTVENDAIPNRALPEVHRVIYMHRDTFSMQD